MAPAAGNRSQKQRWKLLSTCKHGGQLGTAGISDDMRCAHDSRDDSREARLKSPAACIEYSRSEEQKPASSLICVGAKFKHQQPRAHL